MVLVVGGGGVVGGVSDPAFRIRSFVCSSFSLYRLVPRKGQDGSNGIVTAGALPPAAEVVVTLVVVVGAPAPTLVVVVVAVDAVSVSSLSKSFTKNGKTAIVVTTAAMSGIFERRGAGEPRGIMKAIRRSAHRTAARSNWIPIPQHRAERHVQLQRPQPRPQPMPDGSFVRDAAREQDTVRLSQPCSDPTGNAAPPLEPLGPQGTSRFH
jgi:hypothetical protein